MEERWKEERVQSGAQRKGNQSMNIHVSFFSMKILLLSIKFISLN